MYNMARSRIAPTLGTCIPFPAMRTIAFAETGNSTCEMLAALAANSVAGMPWLSSNSMGVIVLLAWVLYKERQFVVSAGRAPFFSSTVALKLGFLDQSQSSLPGCFSM